MKFGKRLKHQIEESLPEWRNQFLSYKNLKKLVKLISSAPTELPESSKAEAEFVHLLNSEIDKFNAFFVEQEEGFIIRQKELQDSTQKVMTMLGPADTCPSESEYREEMRRIRKDIVNLHGEMVLLENYSNVNYTGLAKILKKYDKRTGRLLRSPFIKKVLEQPFFTTDLISQLVKECENIMEMVFPLVDNTGETPGNQGKAAISAMTDRSIFRNTVVAIETMREMRKASSTRSPLSLPPLNLPENDLIHSVQIHSPVSIV